VSLKNKYTLLSVKFFLLHEGWQIFVFGYFERYACSAAFLIKTAVAVRLDKVHFSKHWVMSVCRLLFT